MTKHRTSIEWTHVPSYIGATLNPIRARDRSTGKIGWFCVHASDGCKNCYAEALNRRFGTGIDFKAQNRGRVELFLDEKTLLRPLKWKQPHAIFVCDMTDIFEEGVPDEWIDKIFAMMALCPQHIFFVLTKRVRRMRDYMSGGCVNQRGMKGVMSRDSLIVDTIASDQANGRLPGTGLNGVAWPPPNVLMGVSVEDQKRADERIPELLATKAAVRFVSYEPGLGPVDARQYLEPAEEHGIDPETWRVGACIGVRPALDWLICGGESGPNARKFNVPWARSLVEQCRAAGVACFVKQLGSVAIDPGRSAFSHDPLILKSRKGGDPSEWPEELRVREFPRIC